MKPSSRAQRLLLRHHVRSATKADVNNHELLVLWTLMRLEVVHHLLGDQRPKRDQETFQRMPVTEHISFATNIIKIFAIPRRIVVESELMRVEEIRILGRALQVMKM